MATQPSGAPSSVGQPPVEDLGEMGLEPVTQPGQVYPPPPSLAERAHVTTLEQYNELYESSLANPDRFWAEAAAHLEWYKKWDRVLQRDPPDARWFVGGKTNLARNCLDVHIERGQADRIALLWESQPLDEAGEPEVREYSFAALLAEVNRFATVVRNMGVKPGEVAAICLPRVPELAIAMLACARVGVPHLVLPTTLPPAAMAQWLKAANCWVVLTADAVRTRGEVTPLKPVIDKACEEADCIDIVLTLRHLGVDTAMQEGRDYWMHDLLEEAAEECEPEQVESEDLAMLVYPGAAPIPPRCIMHTTGGYMVHSRLAAQDVLDLHGYEDRKPAGETAWCAENPASMAWQSLGLYGPLLNGASVFLYEGDLRQDSPDRAWQILRRHRITHWCASDLTLRHATMLPDDQAIEAPATIRLICNTGDPLDELTSERLHTAATDSPFAVVETWLQAETGACVLAPSPGVSRTQAGSCALPFFGIEPAVVNREGEPLTPGYGGYLVVRKPWPAMMRGIYGERELFLRHHWRTIEGQFFTGYCARQDQDGQFWIMGHVDDVISSAGHRLGAVEIENELLRHEQVREAAVVAASDAIKGIAVVAFVVPVDPRASSPDFAATLTARAREQIGKIASPDATYIVPGLPRTHTGEIHRRALRSLINGQVDPSDLAALADPASLEAVREAMQQP